MLRWLCLPMASLLVSLVHAESYSYEGELVFEGTPGSLCATGAKIPIKIVGRDDAPGIKFDGYLLGDDLIGSHFSGNDLRSLTLRFPGEGTASHPMQLQPSGPGNFSGILEERTLVSALSGCHAQRATLRFSRTGAHVPEKFAQAAQFFSLDDGAAAAYAQALKGQSAVALATLNKGLAEKEKVFGATHPQLLPYLYFLARLKDITGDYPDEPPLLRRALLACDKTSNPQDPCRGLILAALGAALIKNGDYQAAEASLRQSLRIAEQLPGGEAPFSGPLLNSLSVTQLYTGRYAEARQTLDRAFKVNQKNGGPKSAAVGVTLVNQGVLFRFSGETAKAEAALRQALPINQEALGEENPLYILNLIDLSQILRAEGQYPEAETLARRSLTAARKVLGPTRTDHPALIVALVSLAEVLKDTQRYGEADSLYREALQSGEKSLSPDAPEVGLVCLLLAESLDAQGRTPDALVLLKRAYQISHRSENKIIAWRVPAALMAHYARAPDTRSISIYYGKEAVSTLETQRANLAQIGQEAQDAFVGSEEVTRIYRQLADLLIANQRLGEAQAVRALTKNEELDQFSDGLARREPIVLTLEGAERPLEDSRGKLVALGREYGALQDKYKKNHDLSAQDRARLEVLRKAMDQAQAEFDTRAAAVAASAKDPEAQRRRAQEITDFTRAFQGTLKSLKHQAVLAQYFMLDDRVEILVTTPNTLLARESVIGREALATKIAHFRAALSDPRADPLPQAKELYSLLIAPIAQDLDAAGTKTLMLSLDDALRYLPFAALHDGKGYLIETYSLPIVTEAARDKLLAATNPNWRVWGLGVTKGGADYAPLPYAGAELNAIAGPKGILAGKVLLDRQFSEASLRDGLDQGYPIIHIASHFQFTPGSMEESFLLLGDGSHLTLGAIRTKLNLGNVELLALSACETALGDQRSGRPGAEVEGLGAIAQQAGAHAVLASLWPVADQSTALLMRRLYEAHAHEHLDKADALREAQLALLRGTAQLTSDDGGRRGLARVAGAASTGGKASPVADSKAPFAHPFYWAPFILMGNWE
jgi:CHAT domain-containing protein